MKVNFSRQAANAARGLQPKPARQIATKIARLRVDPHPPDCKKLHGTNHLRVDSGEYRIIYRLLKEDDRAVLQIDAIGKRNDDEVYRRFSKH